MPPVLILLPGLMCDEAVWEPQLPALTPHAGVHIADYGLADCLAHMAEAVIGWAPARFALAGHSMGGRVALEIVRRVPARVTALALLDTHYLPRPGGVDGERESAARWALVELARREGMRAVGQRWLEIPMVHPQRLRDAVLVERILAMIERRTPAQFEAQVRALLGRPDASPVLPTIACPTLILCGADDRWSSLAGHQQMAALIRHSSLVSIPHCGHMATLEQPEPVNAALQRWLGRAGAALPAPAQVQSRGI
jgi:pimeloyl-ACP methyl ester carboxylesterase